MQHHKNQNTARDTMVVECMNLNCKTKVKKKEMNDKDEKCMIEATFLLDALSIVTLSPNQFYHSIRASNQAFQTESTS